MTCQGLAMSSAAAAGFPSWVMLEPFVFRRDDDESFPDDTEAPIRASGTTSWGPHFRVAFSLAEPPLISRIYAQLPGFPDPKEQVPLAILATHRHLVLFRVGIKTPEFVRTQDFFIYNAASAADNPNSSLKALPTCTERKADYARCDGRLSRGSAKQRLLTVASMGLLSLNEQEFVVAELMLYRLSRTKVYADICLLRSSCISADSKLGGEWEYKRVSILGSHNPDDAWQLCCWETDTVIPFDGCLCWIDYYRGIIFCDVSGKPKPTVSFLWFPLDKLPSTNARSSRCSWLYRSVSAVDSIPSPALKFVNVNRDDGIGYGPLKSGAGFTITCHTLMSGTKVWNKDYMVTSQELWTANSSQCLPHEILMFPQVDIKRPHIVHFLMSELKYVMKKMWVVSIDMNTKIVESFSPYVNGFEDLKTKDADLTKDKSSEPMPFFPSEFSRFLHLSRKRKDME